ncbi:MAG: hypothetical protein EZS28_039217, partial [Streblomastix strix]
MAISNCSALTAGGIFCDAFDSIATFSNVTFGDCQSSIGNGGGMYCNLPKNTNQLEKKQEIIINVEEILRQLQILPIRPLGFGSFGIVYLVYDLEYGIVAAKISIKNKTIQREWEAAVNIHKKIQSCPFILKYLKQLDADKISILLMEYASLKTLDIIVKYPQIPLPISTIRALMKQILEGMKVFHGAR